MSPSEDQLRAALRSGEGGVPDPDAIIGSALQVKYQRHQRRMRLAGAAAAVVVVGGIGFGITKESGDSGSNAENAASGGGTSSAHVQLAAPPGAMGGLTNGTADIAGGAGGSGGFAAGVTEPSYAGCPAAPVRYALAGGGGTDQFGASGSLFSGPVTAIVVCRYNPTAGGKLLSSDLVQGADATTLAAQLDKSTLKNNSLLCLSPLSMELIPKDVHGHAMTPISITGTCSQAMVTNGTAVRYVPLAVFGFAASAPASATLQPSSGMMSGSPPR